MASLGRTEAEIKDVQKKMAELRKDLPKPSDIYWYYDMYGMPTRDRSKAILKHVNTADWVGDRGS